MNISISLKKAWLYIVLLAVLVPVFVVMIWFGLASYNSQLKSGLVSEQRINQLSRIQIEDQIKQLKILLQSKSDPIALLLNKADQQSSLIDINTLLALIMERETLIRELMILTPNGRVIAAIDHDLNVDGHTVDTPTKLQAVAEHWGFIMGEESPETVIPMLGRTYTGTYKKHNDYIGFTLAVPIAKPTQAIFIAIIDINKLWSSKLVNDKNIQHYLLDRRGALMTNINNEQYVQGDLMTHLPIARLGLIGKSWPIETPYLGANNAMVFGTNTVIPSVGWTIVSEINTNHIIEPIMASLMKITAITLLGLALFIILVLYIANKTINPINKVCKAVEQLAQGDNLKPLEKNGIQELDVLMQGFNDMAKARSLIQKNLKASEAQFRGVLENTNDGVLFVNEIGHIILVNSSISAMTGYAKEELIGKPIEFLVPHRFKTHKQQRKNYQKEHVSRHMGPGLDLYMLCKDNKELPVEIGLTPVDTGEQTFVAATLQDISVRKKADAKIQHQAYFDYLTDLPNRLLCLDRLSQLLADAKRNNKLVAILFLDLDDFKKINDTLGHEIGDKILIEASHRLKHIMRESDTVGRLGGDEFIVLVGDLEHADDVRPVAEHIVSRFRDSFKIDERELIMSISVGIALFPLDGKNKSTLLRNADSAMYHSKASGRNTYSYFTQQMNEELSRQVMIEEQMHDALEREEFEVYYQPKIDLNTMSVVGAEALLRWKNTALGQVSPDEFIPIAEHTGLILPIGKFVLSSALSATQQWHKTFNEDFCIAVNFSPNQFRDSELASFIERQMTTFNIAPKCLEIEITEGVLIKGHGHIIDAFRLLYELGVSIAMDDFGTGYSSLSYLRQYPFTVLKIDRSFVHDVITVESSRKLTEATITMSHGLNLKVVAEGIETPEQLALLKSMKCDYGQGYLFGKPMNISDFTHFMSAQKPLKEK